MPNPPALRRSTHNVRRKSVPQLHPTSQDPDPASRNLEAEAEAQRRRRSSRRVTAPAFRVAEPDFSMYDQLPQPILTSESWREQTRARAERQPQRQHRSSRDPEYSRSMTTGRT
ncbi:hypothetical protein CERSUDRAFT_118006 [Gelatoporia subvermispora B]|uniref:Uncharacterized protein n=1 Tax=Ceriporiopsis subvermispora (strain B) TaxID=914234 RepID=M2R5H1_CERS8|nr:hypothetical protein CERSUDRAFT_118006 [Gelatoporia subvermispora B]